VKVGGNNNSPNFRANKFVSKFAEKVTDKTMKKLAAAATAIATASIAMNNGKKQIDENFEDTPILYSKRRLGDGICYIYKLYKCRCHLCGKEYHFKSSDFVIRNDFYGKRAKDGYYSDTYCNCHKISSFQWRTLKIFHEYNIKYKVEVSFPDLYGIEHKNLLRFDFAIFDKENQIKFLIECQGEQHYKPFYEFGGNKAFESQAKNDQLKRNFAKRKNIPLIEIPYTCNSYDDEISFLKKSGVIE
jgi:hypothetical protein